MAISGFFGRGAAITLVVSCALAGCSSVDYQDDAGLKAERLTAPLPKPETETAFDTDDATIAVAEADAASDETGPQAVAEAPAKDEDAVKPVETASTAPLPAAAQASAMKDAFDSGRLGTASAGTSEIPLTPEIVAMQSVVPTPKPGGVMLAYAGGAKNTALDAVNTRPQAAAGANASPATGRTELNSLIAKYAAFYDVPEDLVHRVVHRESRYNPKAFNRGHFGLMQIKYATARSMGFRGEPDGLFDAETNLKYAVKYLRGAYLVADNSHDGAVRLYARGYYYDAKRKGMLHVLK